MFFGLMGNCLIFQWKCRCIKAYHSGQIVEIYLHPPALQMKLSKQHNIDISYFFIQPFRTTLYILHYYSSTLPTTPLLSSPSSLFRCRVRYSLTVLVSHFSRSRVSISSLASFFRINVGFAPSAYSMLSFWNVRLEISSYTNCCRDIMFIKPVY